MITVAEAVKEVGKLISVESARRILQTRFLDARLGSEPTTMLPWTGQNQPRI
jgi:hypothetical protein